MVWLSTKNENGKEP